MLAQLKNDLNTTIQSINTVQLGAGAVESSETNLVSLYKPLCHAEALAIYHTGRTVKTPSQGFIQYNISANLFLTKRCEFAFGTDLRLPE